MSKMSISPIEKGRIRLRLIQEADLSKTLFWRNQDHIRKWFFYSEVLTPEQHRQWFKNYQDRDNDLLFIIEEMCNLNKSVGQVGLYNIDWDQSIAEFGRLLIGEEEARGRGFAKEASRLLLDFASQNLKIEKFYLESFGDNKSALAVYHACGFRKISEESGKIKMVRAGQRGEISE